MFGHEHEDSERLITVFYKILDELKEIREELHCICEALQKPKAQSGTTVFTDGKGEAMDISVHISDVPKKAVAKEWTGPLGTGVQVPNAGAITFTSDNVAAVTVDPNSGQLVYVAAGVANISWSDAALPGLAVQSGAVTVSADVAVSGTTEFI